MSPTRTILKYALQSGGCYGIACSDCSLQNEPVCQHADRRFYNPGDFVFRSKETLVHLSCLAYIRNHPELFSDEDIAEVLL